MMKLKQKLIKSFRKLSIPIRIILVILIAIGIFRGLRWMGLKGLFGMIIGMAAMLLILINKRMAFMTKFLIRALRGEEDLIEYLKKGGAGADDYIEVGKYDNIHNKNKK